jgi:NAD(P)H-nitrite reductase large subunit
MAWTCSCKGVRDDDVVAVIDAGARTVDDVAAACGAGTDCGTCVPTIEALLALGAGDAATQPSEGPRAPA